MTSWPEYHFEEHHYLSWLILTLMVLPFAVGIGWFLRRRGKNHGFHTARRPWPSRPARIAEGLTLLLGGGIVVALVSMTEDLNGLVLVSGELRPEFAVVIHLLAAGAAVAVLFGAVFAFRGFSGHGYWVVFLVLVVYPLLLVLPLNIPQRLAPGDAARPVISYTIRTHPDITGADLFINNVYVGRTPVTITADEVEAKVPYWPDPPEEFIPMREIHRARDREPGDKAWIRIPGVGDAEVQSAKQYYARARYGERWLEKRTEGGTSKSDRVASSFVPYNVLTRYDTILNAYLPGFHDNIEALLDQARLSGYNVGPAWFEAIESYGLAGWDAVRKVRKDEPGMRKIADGWAARRFAFNPNARGDEAWAMFKDLCEVGAGDPLSDAIAAYAVNRLVPHLDQERLANHTVSVFHEQKDLPARLLDAVRQVDEILDEPGKPDPNIIETKVSPLFLCWKKDIETALELGGPAPDRYLVRQDCWKKHDYRSPDSMGTPGHEVNRWFYLLANRDSPEGKALRAKHDDAVLEMAGGFIDGYNEYYMAGHFLKFLFLDNELGPDSPAMRFWPRFKAWLRNKIQLPPPGSSNSRGLEESLHYLTRMEPATPTELYATCLRDWPRSAGVVHSVIREMVDYSTRLSATLRGDPIYWPPELSFARWREIIQALILELEENRNFYLQCPNTSLTEEFLDKTVISSLQEYLRRVTLQIESTWGFDDEEAVNALLGRGGNISAIDPDRIRKCLDSLPRWLTNHPDSELLPILAGAGNADLRMTVFPAVRKHPTPVNRALLEKLLTDPDEEVRAAAENVKRELDELAATQPSEFALPLAGGQSSHPSNPGIHPGEAQ